VFEESTLLPAGNPNWEFLQMILDYKDQLEFNPLQVILHSAEHLTVLRTTTITEEKQYHLPTIY
jgi:hypothetical protein